MRLVLIQALIVVAAVFVFLYLRGRAAAERRLRSVNQLQRSILDAAGQMVLAWDVEGRFLVFNPAAERLLGYRSEEVIGQPGLDELFAEGELTRLGQELSLPLNLHAHPPEQGTLPLSSLLGYVKTFTSSQVRQFEIQFKRKDGTIFPGLCALSGIRDSTGEVTGLLAVVTDITARKRAEHALRESEERYRDLFEHSNEMIATISPNGRFLYVNSAWQAQLGHGAEAFEGYSFESAFPPEVQVEAAGILRRALAGERIERSNLRMLRRNGTGLEAEASLSCRRENGIAVSIRCILRDVTEQKRRERRMSMQLAVSQTVAEATSSDQLMPQLLDALIVNLGWDVADLWVLDSEQLFLRFSAHSSAPGLQFEEFHRDSQGRVYTRGQGLPGRIWAQGTPVWIENIHIDENFPRRFSARVEGLITGWGVPVRAGNQVVATIQFYSRYQQTEDHELMTTVETVCASLGQFLGRTAQEQRVRELNRQKESILNSVADGIFGLDPEGRVTFVNPAASRMLAISPSLLVGRTVHAIVHENRNDGEICNERCRMLRALLSREGASDQESFYRRDGSSFPVEFSVTQIVDQGVIAGGVLSFHDISQRYALERMKDEFISTVSHELRTPLTSIRGALGLLSAGLLGSVSDKASNLLRIAVTNTDRLVRLINDILDLERMESGRAPLQFRSCSIPELAIQSVETMSSMADAAQVRLVLDSVPISLEADPDRMVQVFTNLLSNAIKFSPPGSAIRIVFTPRSDALRISIIDQGRGIPEDKLESIFDRFQQVDASDSRQKGGTGLGLAICRTIIQQHGGRIWVERNPVKGVTFHILLPRAQGDVLPPEPVQRAARTTRESTILVCGSDITVRSLIGETLEQNGYHIVSANSAEQAILLARETLFDAILLDLDMPALGGWDTLRRLKDDATTAPVPVVILSLLCPPEEESAATNGSSPLISKRAENGATEDAATWLQKPFHEEQLLTELGKSLHGPDGGARILLVEDDDDLAQVIIASFERAGVHILHASTQKEAVDLCRQVRPDMMILDLMLPDGNGLGLIDWLRQDTELRRLPLVVYSARGINDLERNQLRLGPTEFLTKAKVHPEEVERLVLTMVRKGREPFEIAPPLPADTGLTVN